MALALASGAVLVLTATPQTARAVGLSLGWLDCRTTGGVGGRTRAFDCLSQLSEFPLFPAIVLAAPIDSVVAVELVIDVDVAEDPLPAWWHMEPGGCRDHGWSADTQAASCTDPWGGVGAATVQGWLPGTPGNSGRHGRLLVAAGVVSNAIALLDANTPYTPCRVLLRTVGTLTCDGCLTPACLVLNSMLFRRLPGSSVEEMFFSDAETAGQNMVLWQPGPGADCQAVPTRRATWGAVKALYH